MRIRTAILSDLDAINAVEAECFSVEEADTKDYFEARLKVYPEHFWILKEDDEKIVSFINGMVGNK